MSFAAVITGNARDDNSREYIRQEHEKQREEASYTRTCSVPAGRVLYTPEVR